MQPLLECNADGDGTAVQLEAGMGGRLHACSTLCHPLDPECSRCCMGADLQVLWAHVVRDELLQGACQPLYAWVRDPALGCPGLVPLHPAWSCSVWCSAGSGRCQVLWTPDADMWIWCGCKQETSLLAVYS